MARHSKSASPREESIQLYRILPLFKNSLFPVLGFLATHRVARAFESDPTPQHWRELFKNELEWQITAGLRTSQIGEQQINQLAERWLMERAANEVIGTKLEHKAELFAELAVAGGMPIDPQSPFQVAQDYLQARAQGETSKMELIVAETADRSFDTKIKTDDFLALPPIERLEMMLTSMSLRGPSGGAPRQLAESFET